MVFPIAGGNESKGYEISNSLRFNPGDSPRLTRTTGTATNETKFTYSTWIKQNVASSGQFAWLTSGSLNSGTDCFLLNFNDQKFQFVTTGATDANVISNAVFRDESAWYHFVVEVDTTQGTAANRMKFYVNGTQLTSFGTASYPSQDYTFTVSSQTAVLGAYDEGGYAGHFDGYMAETHYIDGTAYDADNFGKTNNEGVWIPKKFSGSYGNNGFYLEFKQTGTSQNSSGIGADTSGNDNHFAVTNLAATDVTADTPTNNFATLNPLLTDTTRTTFSEGNCKNVNTNASTAGATIAVDKGKWYCEMICTAKTAVNAVVGICTVDGFDGERQIDESQNGGSGHGYVMNATKLPGGASYGATWAVDDIMGIALDLDSTQNTITFYKNNSSQGSINIDNKLYVFANSNGQGSDTTITYSNNFGNAPHSISSGNTDENGYGNFEYAPPSGYYALCTKNLAEFG